MKLPNGFGTVYKLQGNRRRPYVVKKTIQGKQKALGYFATFDEAMAYLVDHNRNPRHAQPKHDNFQRSIRTLEGKALSRAQIRIGPY